MNAKVRLNWTCPFCSEENSLMFTNIEWSIDRDRCGDVSTMWLILPCKKCKETAYSEDNNN